MFLNNLRHQEINKIISCLFRRILVLTLVALSVGVCGCDKVCHYKSSDVAPVHNLTGRALTLTVCKFPSQRQQVQVASVTSSTLSLGEGEASTIKGGGDAIGSCNTPDGESRIVGFSLAQESFNEVRLCRDKVSLEYYLIDVTVTCPLGSLEQSMPAVCL